MPIKPINRCFAQFDILRDVNHGDNAESRGGLINDSSDDTGLSPATYIRNRIGQFDYSCGDITSDSLFKIRFVMIFSPE